jgi:hypothetical protein
VLQDPLHDGRIGDRSQQREAAVTARTLQNFEQSAVQHPVNAGYRWHMSCHNMARLPAIWPIDSKSTVILTMNIWHAACK